MVDSLEDGLNRLNRLTHLEEKPTNSEISEEAFELSDGTYLII